MRRRFVYGIAIAITSLCFAAGPVSAETVVKEKTCKLSAGANDMTYDCKFKARTYEVGTPLTLDINYACTGDCGPVLSFGTRETRGKRVTSGRLIGGRRTDSGLQLTFVFDAPESGKKSHHGPLEGHFAMTVLMDDGYGNRRPVTCPVDMRVKK